MQFSYSKRLPTGKFGESAASTWQIRVLIEFQTIRMKIVSGVCVALDEVVWVICGRIDGMQIGG